jgi:hypothetical protein
MDSLIPYGPSGLAPSRLPRQTAQALNLVRHREAVARAQVGAVVRITTDALAGAAAIKHVAGVLAARDPLANDALNMIADTGIARLAMIVGGL